MLDPALEPGQEKMFRIDQSKSFRFGSGLDLQHCFERLFTSVTNNLNLNRCNGTLSHSIYKETSPILEPPSHRVLTPSPPPPSIAKTGKII
jgi:hypothetical protein